MVCSVKLSVDVWCFSYMLILASADGPIGNYKYSKESCPRKRNLLIVIGRWHFKGKIIYLLSQYTLMKKCHTCKEIKPLNDFYKNKTMADGHHGTCKLCIKSYQSTIKDKLKEYQKQYQPKYKVEHREELLAYLKEYQRGPGKEKHYANIKAWRAANPDKVAQYRATMAERAKAKKQVNDQ